MMMTTIPTYVDNAIPICVDTLMMTIPTCIDNVIPHLH